MCSRVLGAVYWNHNVFFNYVGCWRRERETSRPRRVGEDQNLAQVTPGDIESTKVLQTAGCSVHVLCWDENECGDEIERRR